MKKVVFYLFIFFIVLCLLRIIFIALFIGGKLWSTLDYEDAKKTFENQKEEMYVVSKYFSEPEYDRIYIPYSMSGNEMSVDGGGIVSIKSDEVIRSIYMLKKRGCQVVGKNNNSVYFQFWSNLDSGRGIVFSIDGTNPELDYLTNLQRINEDNWYYYEEDYNEWELQNYTNGIPNKFLGRWNIECIKVRGTGEEYPIQNLEGFVGKVGAEMTFNSDGTFQTESNTKYGLEKCSGKYILRYEEKILLKYDDGSEGTVKYLSNNYQMVYYTVDSNQVPIDVYYKKSLGD